MENVTQIIKSHNKNIISPKVDETSLCNCRNKLTCPLDGKCLSKSVVYKCVVTTSNDRKVYLGLTEMYGRNDITTILNLSDTKNIKTALCYLITSGN